MSTKRGSSHRRRHRGDGWSRGDELRITVAWAPDDASLAEAKQMSHDSVIATLGPARTGGVRWSITHGQGALDALEVMVTQRGPGRDEDVELIAKMRGLLQDEGGYLVVAMAPGRRP